MNTHLVTLKNNLKISMGAPPEVTKLEADFFHQLLQLISAELLALVTTQEDKDKITAYFAEDV